MGPVRVSLLVASCALALVCGLLLAPVGAAAGSRPGPAGLLPDLRTVVPTHLNLVNKQQRDLLRFSNGIANTGVGPWALRSEPPPGTTTSLTTAVQELWDSTAFYACGTQPKQVTVCHNVVSEHVAGQFEYHPTHNHWHVGEVALFEVHRGGPNGALVGGLSAKTGFCLIDLYNLAGNAPTKDKLFWDCYSAMQGIAPGWVDQYHQSTEGQQVDITDVPDGDDYYLVSVSNPNGAFLESDNTNNSAWVRFALTGKGTGNRKVTELGHSPCDSPGLCGEVSANR